MESQEILALLEQAGNKNWEEVDLSNKGLSSIPDLLWDLTNIKFLNLSNNRIKNIPEKISNLYNLKWIIIDNNCLANMPFCIFDMSSVEILTLNANLLDSIPEINTNNCQIRIIDLSENRLSTFPRFLTNIKTLEWLDISDNKIPKIPPQIKNLGNLITFNVSNNLLFNIPPEIRSIKSLQTFDCRNNLNLHIPNEVLNNYWDSTYILDYYFRQKDEEKKPINEIKMIVVGNSSVGKTSLIKSLTNKGVDVEPDKTDKIDIITWEIDIDNILIKINIWDFGGQEIFFDLHQLFLTKNSFYVLVLNNRDDERTNKLHHWLKMIESLGESSSIIIVGNKSDLGCLDIDKKGLKEKYQNIQGFFETSCKNQTGIEVLRNGIKKQLSKIERVFKLIPQSYFRVKDELQALNKTENSLTYSDYQDICRKYGINNYYEHDDLLEILHDLGVVLNFSNQENFKGINVLNPNWIVEGAYSILNDNLLITQKKGRLSKDDIPRIFKTLQEPKENYRFRMEAENWAIVQIMAQYGLCFKLDDQLEYLIPGLLPKGEPDTGEWNKPLHFQFHYKPVLPHTIISRFIVKSHDLISKNTYWRTGVVLNKDRARAKVKADLDDNKIIVHITGNCYTRRSLLSLIRENFKRVHKTIDKLEVDERVPLPNKPNITVSYQHLLKLEEQHIKEFYPEGADHSYNVKELLDSYREDQKNNMDNTQSSGNTIIFGGSNTVVNSSQNTSINQTENDMTYNENEKIEVIISIINNALDNLIQNNPDATENGKIQVINASLDKTKKERLINAIKSGGKAAIENFLDNAYINTTMAAIEGWRNP
ncbi:MAG: COR domain-containing protein [Crocosphaera sp.]